METLRNIKASIPQTNCVLVYKQIEGNEYELHSCSHKIRKRHPTKLKICHLKDEGSHFFAVIFNDSYLCKQIQKWRSRTSFFFLVKYEEKYYLVYRRRYVFLIELFHAENLEYHNVMDVPFSIEINDEGILQ